MILKSVFFIKPFSSIIKKSHDKNLNILKSGSHLSKTYVICFIESPLKVMKNAFYLVLKALFVLKIFKFLSWLFGHAGKTA